jgi:formylmethanofuran dehydrogenase subunit B
MDHAWIDGRPVDLRAACAEAARLLQQSRLPLVAGLETDVAGARAAIALAQRAGAVIDHMHSEALLHDLEVMRDAGMMTTTPSEAGLHADVLLLAGPVPHEEWPQLAPAMRDKGSQSMIWLCPERADRSGTVSEAKMPAIGRKPDDLPALLAALRVTLAGRPVERAPVPAKALAKLAAQLQAARFGVAVWSAATLDALTIEMLCGLIKDLNAKTRFSGLSSLPPSYNALGVLQVCGWMSAFPPRTGFARGFAEHDPWRFETRRLVASGEVDCVVWISAFGSGRPPWTHGVPMISLTNAHASLSHQGVHIAVGRPGLDHDAVAYLRAAGTLTWTDATATRTTIRVSDALNQIAAALPASVRTSC